MKADPLLTRLWRLARRQILETLGWSQGSAFRADRPGPARRMKVPAAYGTPHPLEADYRLLGAPLGADLPRVRSCWLRLVREHHPDRFADDPGRSREAAETMVRLNAAYERIRADLSRRA